jgi:hypothetical protein
MEKSTSFWPKATDERLAWNDVINGSNRTPKEYPNPSENSIKKQTKNKDLHTLIALINK